MEKNKSKVLYIAYFFPPVDAGGIPGAMRVLKFLRHVDVEGRVLTQKPHKKLNYDKSVSSHLIESHITRAGVFDPFSSILKFQFKIKQLLKNNRSETPVSSIIAVSSVNSDSNKNQEKPFFSRIKDFIYDLNYFPDQASCWILPAFIAGSKLMNREQFRVIFATGSPWSSLVVGYLLSRRSKIPLIADFRDPWIDNPFHRSKGTLLDSWAVKLEKIIVKHAYRVTLNTEPLRDEFVKRYPELDEQKFVVLPNGFEPLASEGLYRFSEDTTDLVIRHAGSLYGPRDPSVLLDAIRRVNERFKKSGVNRRWKFEQIGAISLSIDLQSKYKNMIEDGSFKIVSQLPFDECQLLLKTADLLVNIQPGTKTQIPSKIYDYMSVGRPFFNITPKTGALGRMVEMYHLGACFDNSESEEIEKYLTNYLQDTSWCMAETYEAKEKFSIKSISDVLTSMINDI